MALNAFGQNFHFGTIVFDPGTTDDQKERVNDAIDRLGRLGDTGAAMESFVTSTDVRLTIAFSSRHSAQIRRINRSAYRITLNPRAAFLSRGAYYRGIGWGEVPTSNNRTTNDAIVLGHEFAHIPASGLRNRHDRESNVIHNYENDFRAAAGLSPRTSYGGKDLNPNRSNWQRFKDWWNSRWE